MLHNPSISLAGFNSLESIHFCLMLSPQFHSYLSFIHSTLLWNMSPTSSPHLNLTYPFKYRSNLTSAPFLDLIPDITVLSEFPNHFSVAMHSQQVTVRNTNVKPCPSLRPRAFFSIKANESEQKYTKTLPGINELHGNLDKREIIEPWSSLGKIYQEDTWPKSKGNG